MDTRNSVVPSRHLSRIVSMPAVMEVAQRVVAKGFVVIQFTSPRKPEGIYEEFVRAATKLFNDFGPAVLAAGGGESKMLADMLWNTPSNQFIIDFEDGEKALAFLASPAFRNWLEAFRKLGALDMKQSAYRLWTR